MRRRQSSVAPRPSRRGSRLLAGAFALALVLPAAASSQSSRDLLVLPCPVPAECLGGALAVEAIQAGVGLLVTGGSELPGSVSTLGRRFGSTPRVAISGRLGVVNGSWPALGLGGGAGASAPERSAWVTSFTGSLAIGLFPGFRPLPTVGGVLAVDLLATAGVGLLPGGDGFQDDATAFGYGVRIGLIRESFTLPGLTVSGVRRHLNDLEWRSPEAPGAAEVRLEGPVATSVRATLGKDLLALGISAGVGWERVQSDGSFGVVRGDGTGNSVSAEGFRTDRTLFFGGLTATFLVLQVHGEAGYAAGFEPLSDRPDNAFDPSAGSVFASLSARLLF